jgi:hypothetical protein
MAVLTSHDRVITLLEAVMKTKLRTDKLALDLPFLATSPLLASLPISTLPANFFTATPLETCIPPILGPD